jgi:hypothetical protein
MDGVTTCYTLKVWDGRFLDENQGFVLGTLVCRVDRDGRGLAYLSKKEP